MAAVASSGERGAGRDILIAAVDIGATKTLVAVVQAPLAAWPTDLVVHRLATDPDPTVLATRIAEAIRELTRGARVAAIGMGAPGPLDAETGVVHHSPNLRWRDVPLADIVSAAVRAPAILDDDANAGALGEARLGAGVGCDPLAYLTLSTGIGSGIVVGGRIVRGAHGGAGEVGHLGVRADGPACSCGGRGHVEAYAGGACLAARAGDAWRAEGRLGAAPQEASAILELAEVGDRLASTLVADATEAIAVALSALVATVDPALIVVGGSLGLAHPELVRRAAYLASRRVMPGADVAGRIVAAALADRAVLAGAAVLAADSIS